MEVGDSTNTLVLVGFYLLISSVFLENDKPEIKMLGATSGPNQVSTVPLPLPLQSQRVTWGQPRSGWDSRGERCNSGRPFHQAFPVSHLPGREGCGEGGLFHGLRPSKIGLEFVA